MALIKDCRFYLIICAIVVFCMVFPEDVLATRIGYNPQDGYDYSQQQVTLSTYTVALPIVLMGMVTLEPIEIDYPGCRWPYNGGGNPLPISFRWGDRLQTPSLWRNAFEAGLAEWNGSIAHMYYYHHSSSENVINTLNDPAWDAGVTFTSCIQPYGVTSKVEIYGNIYWESHYDYTANHRQGIATHELGHGASVGHVRPDYPWWALMFRDHSLDEYGVRFRPESPDFELINQAYP